MLKKLFYALVPFGILLLATALACVVGYFVLLGLHGKFELSKIISKTTQVFLVLSIFPAMAYLNIDKVQLGFAERGIFVKQLLCGFGLGFITLMPVFVLLTVVDVNVVDVSQHWTAGSFVKKLSISLLLALIISLIEEPLFRGILLSGLSKQFPKFVAIFISAFYYAILHFLSTDTVIPMEQLNLLSGFTLLVEAFQNLTNPVILPAFFPLLMVGIFLGLLRVKNQAGLGLCIGCHTCWVWQIKMNKTIFNTDFTTEHAYWVSHYDGVIGPLVTVWLGLAVVGWLSFPMLKKKLKA